MDDMFCFTYADPLEADIERKKIERGIQVVVKWPHIKELPTITYEMRCDYFGTIAYRVKYNETVWAYFENGGGESEQQLIAGFRKALGELATAKHKNEDGTRRETDAINEEAAAKFFRSRVRAL